MLTPKPKLELIPPNKQPCSPTNPLVKQEPQCAPTLSSQKAAPAPTSLMLKTLGSSQPFCQTTPQLHHRLFNREPTL